MSFAPFPASLQEMTKPIYLALSQIRTDGGTQIRAALNLATVEAYAALMQEGVTFSPVVVFYDGQTYWLADGFHRLQASMQIGISSVLALILQGSQREAILYSVGANVQHGLPRTNADKRRAVETLLKDEVWSQWSDREIAQRAGVSNCFVSNVHRELKSANCSHLRKGSDGRIINTSNIGRHKKNTVNRPSFSIHSDKDFLTEKGSQSSSLNHAQIHTKPNLTVNGSQSSEEKSNSSVNRSQSSEEKSPDPQIYVKDSAPFFVGNNVYLYTDSDISPIWREEIVEVIEKSAEAVKAVVKIYL